MAVPLPVALTEGLEIVAVASATGEEVEEEEEEMATDVLEDGGTPVMVMKVTCVEVTVVRTVVVLEKEVDSAPAAGAVVVGPMMVSWAMAKRGVRRRRRKEMRVVECIVKVLRVLKAVDL
jgi:hypothetical protein